jgi:hypothetical protein
VGEWTTISMKLLNISFASILIASVLLLSVAKNATAENLTLSQGLPQENSAPQQAEAYSAQHSSPIRTGQTPSAINSPSGQSSTEESGTDRNQHASRLQTLREWIATISAQGFFNFIVAVATVFIAWFNWQLVGVTNEMKKATSDAAQAAAKSADAAQAALHADRPYLLVTDVLMAGSGSPTGALHVIPIKFENFGSGPADIQDYIAEPDVLPWPKPDAPDPVAWHSPEEGNRLHDSLVRAGETIGIEAPIFLDEQKRQQMVDGNTKLRIEGRIRYRGAPQRQYVTKFYWWFIPIDKSTGANWLRGSWVMSLTESYNSRD